MKYLTFLDYPTVEAVGTSYAAKLKEKDKEIEELRRRDKDNAERIAQLEAKIDDVYNQWEVTVKDEGEMVRKGGEAVRNGVEATHNFLRSMTSLKREVAEYMHSIRELAGKMGEVSRHKQMTKGQKIRYLSSVIENLSNSAAEAETFLTEGTRTSTLKARLKVTSNHN